MSKIIVDREQLISKLSKSIKFVPSKLLIPAFENFMLTVKGDNMEILATDGNIQIKMNCPVKAKEDMAICLPAKLLLKTVSLFRENEVTITRKSDIKVEIKSGKSKYNISMDCFPTDFPVMPTGTISSEITMQQFYLNLGLKSAEKFVDEENQNANFSGLRIAEMDNKIIFTGVSQSAMCRVAVKPISINTWTDIVIPPATAIKVIGLLGDKGEVGVAHSGDKIVFFTDVDSAERYEITSTTANIKFPPTESIFQKRSTDGYIVNTLEFLDAVKRLKLYSGIGEEPCVSLVLTEGTELQLTSSDSMTGKDGEESITISNMHGKAINKNFKNVDLIQILANVDTNEFFLYFSEAHNMPSFIIPKVNTEEENIFSFLIAGLIKG